MMMERALRVVEKRALRAGDGFNVVAFSGGVDSSVVAKLVRTRFPENTVAAIGVSPSLAKRELEMAVMVGMEDVGVQVVQVATDEGSKREYVENRGQSCYHCKTTLYAEILRAIRDHFRSDRTQIFNGTNKDDLGDPTRVGLVAAREFDVVSPLDSLTKQEVRTLARDLGLHRVAHKAASPCLRSRLAFGVEAVEKHLKFVENAEEVIRDMVDFTIEENMRFRMLPKQHYRVEVDASKLDALVARKEQLSEKLGIHPSLLSISTFKSGNVAAKTKVSS